MEPPISPSPMNAMVESVMVIFSILVSPPVNAGTGCAGFNISKADAVRAGFAHRAYVKALPEVRVP